MLTYNVHVTATVPKDEQSKIEQLEGDVACLLQSNLSQKTRAAKVLWLNNVIL